MTIQLSQWAAIDAMTIVAMTAMDGITLMETMAHKMVSIKIYMEYVILDLFFLQIYKIK